MDVEFWELEGKDGGGEVELLADDAVASEADGREAGQRGLNVALRNERRTQNAIPTVLQAAVVVVAYALLSAE